MSLASFDTIKFLAQNGSNLNLVNKNGETPLHYAVKTKNIEIATLLISFGSDLTISSTEGTPLQIAYTINDNEMIDHLNKIDRLSRSSNHSGLTVSTSSISNCINFRFIF